MRKHTIHHSVALAVCLTPCRVLPTGVTVVRHKLASFLTILKWMCGRAVGADVAPRKLVASEGFAEECQAACFTRCAAQAMRCRTQPVPRARGRRSPFLRHAITTALLGLALATSAAIADPLEMDFVTPPDAARPGVFWYFMDGNLNGPEMLKELESMKKAGLGNTLFLEVDVGVSANR